MFKRILLAVALQGNSGYPLYATALKPVGIGLAKGSSGGITLRKHSAISGPHSTFDRQNTG